MQANACCESKQTTICENRGRRSLSLPDFYLFRPIIARVRSETQPHLIPCYIAMYGGGHTFVYEAEFCVIMDQFIFAGEHKSFAALDSGIGDGT